MTSLKRKNKTYAKQFKEETVALITEQGYIVIEAPLGFGLTKLTAGNNGSQKMLLAPG